jgi:acid stress-induced BolA-like protein IbaG/YrbA
MSDPNFRPHSFSEEKIRDRIVTGLPGAQVFTQNPNGDGYHFDLIVVWNRFEGLNRVKQHQMVLHLFNEDFASNDLHAMTLKTFTPAAWEAIQNAPAGKVAIE